MPYSVDHLFFIKIRGDEFHIRQPNPPFGLLSTSRSGNIGWLVSVISLIICRLHPQLLSKETSLLKPKDLPFRILRSEFPFDHVDDIVVLHHSRLNLGLGLVNKRTGNLTVISALTGESVSFPLILFDWFLSLDSFCETSYWNSLLFLDCRIFWITFGMWLKMWSTISLFCPYIGITPCHLSKFLDSIPFFEDKISMHPLKSNHSDYLPLWRTKINLSTFWPLTIFCFPWGLRSTHSN